MLWFARIISVIDGKQLIDLLIKYKVGFQQHFTLNLDVLKGDLIQSKSESKQTQIVDILKDQQIPLENALNQVFKNVFGGFPMFFDVFRNF